MKISSNSVAAMAILLIIISSISAINNIGHNIAFTGKATTAQGTAYILILPKTVAAPDLWIFLNDDKITTRLNWTNITDANYYTVYYSSNLTNILDLDLNNIPLDVSSFDTFETSWIDLTANSVIERYYRVASVKGSQKNLSSKTVGKYTYIFYGMENPSNAHRSENWFSIPFNNTETAESMMDTIGDSAEKITKLIRTSNETYQFYTHIHNLNDGKNFNIRYGNGYAVFVRNNINYTAVGDIVIENITYAFYGLDSTTNAHRCENWFGLLFNMSYYAETLLDEIGSSAEKITKLIRTNSTSYQFYTHVHDLNDGKNFKMHFAEGYAIFVKQNLNYTG